MTFPVTIRDAVDDPATVEPMDGHVYLDVEVKSRTVFADLKLTPKQARRLAKALRKAAKIAKENVR